ncbi:GlcG/HbpS family heme-binding protein [Rhizorhabdus dicambivorans]|uniref:Heme-degrading domain-containing protein n=1 Tax=Rhizorhabdus dicambivorans TaxID=1850238 RepID=A0A2A4FTN0_9SPHN|nr:heme-binding protein [Rhizorhabdus dicambivorans]ATE67472.1 heme-degrading domain-containing protein [Rhizorhabdus dicambivorans]PCE41090.1 heme-degrading domain-containing protein [Rhizorhabdus dicambivorans]
MAYITLEQANAIITGAFAKGAELGLKPLGIAVLDAGGHLIAFQRQDGTSTLRPQIATAKASGALALGISSRKIADMAAERPSFVASLGPIASHGVLPAAGGVIVVGADGRAIGAVGVTGDTSDNDELCALAGISAAALTAQA